MENTNYNIKYTDSYNPFIVEKVNKDSVVLDVGCWVGSNGTYLIENKNCIVDGIDFDEKSLKIAKNNGYRNTYNLNLNENYNLDSLRDNNYDCIILADILEHLIYPEKLLSLLKIKLKNDGAIVISTPNIAFILYRCMLFLGRFEYSTIGGVMDINHLRFFTKKTINQLCLDAGYNIEFIKGYSLVKKRFFFLTFLAKTLPTLFALQFILKIKK